MFCTILYKKDGTCRWETSLPFEIDFRFTSRYFRSFNSKWVSGFTVPRKNLFLSLFTGLFSSSLTSSKTLISVTSFQDHEISNIIKNIKINIYQKFLNCVCTKKFVKKLSQRELCFPKEPSCVNVSLYVTICLLYVFLELANKWQ